MVASKRLVAFFLVLVLGLLVPGPQMNAVEAGHHGHGHHGLEALLAAGILAKLLGNHHHHHHEGGWE